MCIAVSTALCVCECVCGTVLL